MMGSLACPKQGVGAGGSAFRRLADATGWSKVREAAPDPTGIGRTMP